MAGGQRATGGDGFERAASGYERARPSYPSGATDLLATQVGVAPATQVCDVGAGTGRLTRVLVARGAQVVAVEQAAAMRAALVSALPSVAVVGATAEALPFDAGRFDVVTVAQAFHWFRPVEALGEIRRVLRPRGGLAIVDSDLDDRVDWVAKLSKISWPAGTAFPTGNDVRARQLLSSGFVELRSARVEWCEQATRESLADRVRSSGSVAAEPETVQAELVDRVLSLVADLGEPFELPYFTDVVCCRRGE